MPAERNGTKIAWTEEEALTFFHPKVCYFCGLDDFAAPRLSRLETPPSGAAFAACVDLLVKVEGG